MYKIALVLLILLVVVSANDIYATGFVVDGESETSIIPSILIIFFFIVSAYIILRGVQKKK